MAKPSAGPVGVENAGLQLQVFFDVDPEKFPDGVELTVTTPGDIGQIVGRVVIARGCVLACINPEQAVPFRQQIRQLQAAASGIQVVQ